MKNRLAIIDDHVMMRAFLKEFFSRDYEVFTFPDVQEAWQWLEEGHFPDLITVDLKMPGLSGMDFLTRIKGFPMFSHIPVIVVSGVDKSHDRIRCLELGAADYITKPFNPQELALRVRRQLNLRKLWS